MNIVKLEEPRALERAMTLLQQGGVVSFPTDTVYGIGASIAHPEALSRIYEMKGREHSRPLPVLLASPSAIDIVSPGVDPRLSRLASHFWPGALTVIVPARLGLPSQLIGEGHTVGVRVPDHSIALTLAQRSGGALAVTSANLSGCAPATRPAEIPDDLGSQLDLILDGGIARLGQASTVISQSNDTLEIIREGAIPGADIQAAWDQILDEGADPPDEQRSSAVAGVTTKASA